MQDTLNNLLALIPTDLDLAAMGKFILILAISTLLLALLVKALFGKGSSFNRSVSAAIGILFIYAASIVIYTFDTADLSRFLSPLPFVAFSGDRLYLFSFAGSQLEVVCSQLLSMVILVFSYNLIDDFMPRGKGLYWLINRILTVVMALGLHYLVNRLMNSLLPGPLITYAPTALLVILVAMLLIGVLKVLLGFVLAVVNPIIAAVYAFFFSSRLGRQLTRAVMTTALLSVLGVLLNHFGCQVIPVDQAALAGYIPLAGALLILWYLLGCIL